jgi:hypothetical protein
MPRFYFDVIDQGIIQTDPEGIELPDLRFAVEQAKRAASEMISERMGGTNLASLKIQVRDGPGSPVVTVVHRVEDDLAEVLHHRKPAGG